MKSDPSFEILPAPVEGGVVDILWIAGEHSGDQHASGISARIGKARPELRQAAIGGPALKNAGVELLHDLTESSVVGLVEVLKHYGYFRKLFAETIEWIRRSGVRMIVLADYPGFNLRLAKALFDAGLSRKAGGDVAVYYYISPQVWAWKGNRRFRMAEWIDELGVIFPFEVDVFADTELETHFVGHPFLSPDFQLPIRYEADGPVLLLPGSRSQATARIFPILLKAAELFSRTDHGRGVGFQVMAADDARRRQIESLASGSPISLAVRSSGEKVHARAVLTSAGTISMMSALAGVPGAIIYRAHPVTYWIGRRLVKIEYLGIANLILKKPMYPEFLQGVARPRRLSEELARCLLPDRVEQTLEDAGRLKALLAAPAESGAEDRICRLLDDGR